MNERPFEYYANGGWQSFSAPATAAIEAAIEAGDVRREAPGARKAKSERRIRRPQLHTPDGTPIDWSVPSEVYKLPGSHLWAFYVCTAPFFKRMRATD